jgi:carboxyl-terminal processing protease
MSLRPITLLGIVLSMVTGIALGISSYHAWLAPEVQSAEARDFRDVLLQVRDSYVDEVGEGELVRGALIGMLGELDPHSRYLDGLDFDTLQAETAGSFGGIGIEVGLVDGFFTVVTPMDNTPAEKAGLNAGDRILELDHVSLRGKRLNEVVELLRGMPGSELHLKIEQDDAEPREVSLTRAVIDIASVDSKLLEPGYGYIRISQFDSTTAEDFLHALRDLTLENDSPLNGLVLDLRNNPGGVLQASVSVADAFLEEGLIVYTSGRLPSSHLKYRASGKDTLAGKPIVILINGGSASAAEIVAGALKDHDRATLLGSKSYGKGSVQSVMPLGDNRAIKLTTAYYYTPSGDSINDHGIEPDVAVDENSAENTDTALLTQALNILKSEPGNLSEELQARL